MTAVRVPQRLDALTELAYAGRTATILRRPVSVGSRTGMIYNSSTPLSDGTVRGGTNRLYHTALCSCHSLRLVYGNWYNLAGVETDGVNDILVAGAIENVSAAPLPVSFNGDRQVTIKPGCVAVSDPLPVVLAKGDLFYTRTFVSVGSGEKFPLGADFTTTGNSEGHNYNAPAGSDLTGFGSSSVASVDLARTYGPAAIIGIPKTDAPPCVLIFGDSIAAGVGDSGTNLDRGWTVRMLNDNYPFLRLAYPGEVPGNVTTSGGRYRARRGQVTGMIAATDAISQLGINSISAGVSTLETNLQSAWNYMAALGVDVYQATMTPYTTSTDSWATVGNQTVTANETTRTTVNDWIRTVPSPLAGVLEVGDAAESARNSGKWKAGYTADGIHPNATGHAAIAAALSASTLFGSAAT